MFQRYREVSRVTAEGERHSGAGVLKLAHAEAAPRSSDAVEASVAGEMQWQHGCSQTGRGADSQQYRTCVCFVLFGVWVWVCEDELDCS
ncbi:hypothetical protein COCVIDRAFT_40576 [Bipolaris victoriae FI3]|uniref:Uncharacterized protein n=1 Tax=Bipolaris victoriae (strain FI3) TaxID=930091 RepID=W7E0K5_BIPV3|nr:hypothetical protein COCVIDRAFT_40576 [Bipolaris victoriae FI3]